jgi:hypothetical protein
MIHETLTIVDTYTIPVGGRIPLREVLLLGKYHLRLLNWWLFLLMFLGFLGSCGLFWLVVHSGTTTAVSNGNEFSRFVLESGAGLVAGLLTSSLVVGDPLLEVMMATRSGIYRVFGWRYLLTLSILLVCSAAYLAWSLAWGTIYTVPQSAFTLLFVWLAPVFAMSTLGLLGALLTRNAALGAVIAAIPLAIALFLHSDLLAIAATNAFWRPFILWFFVPFTLWSYDVPNYWWLNRALLMGTGLILALCCWWLLRREERLLGNLR